MKRMNMKKGFTLVELVIVMVILGALAAYAIPKMTNSKDGAAFGSMKSDARTAIGKAQEMYSTNLSYTAFALNCGGIKLSPDNTCTSTVEADGSFTVAIASTICTNAVTYNSKDDAGVQSTTCK